MHAASLSSAALRSIFALIFLVVGILSHLGCAQNPDTSTVDSSEVTIQEPSSATTSTDTSVDSDVPFVVTPRKTVKGMLELADVSKRDTVYDLGSGDGRVPIMAAKKYGAYGVGIEIKPDLVQRARKNAKLSGVSDKVEFRQQDIFKADFSDATVVTMYLFPEVNIKLRPMLFEQLDPGTRIVSHSFDMDAWEPDSTMEVNGDVLYLWTIPEETPEFVDHQK
ncbi:MAG: cyclopropane-fatty-acyl-phospholipid synthase family protein [Salinibacter sp.]|uniref:SAM-dependent methyltransferase n=1 Tax=Salinibacter sp. TaxID=2065818 RepID=UPI0035D4EA42